MSRHSASGSIRHRIERIHTNCYRLHWVVDRYYPDSNLRHPRRCFRESDHAGAVRFAKRWEVGLPPPPPDHVWRCSDYPAKCRWTGTRPNGGRDNPDPWCPVCECCAVPV